VQGKAWRAEYGTAITSGSDRGGEMQAELRLVKQMETEELRPLKSWLS
jgi:hypothetical protein